MSILEHFMMIECEVTWSSQDATSECSSDAAARRFSDDPYIPGCAWYAGKLASPCVPLGAPKTIHRTRHHGTTTVARMLFPTVALFAAASSLLSFATAHNIQMKAHQRECFHESLHKDDKMTVTFQVGDREFGGSGNLEIDFWVGHALF